MLLYGLALYTLKKNIEWYMTREDAETAGAVVRDEPGFDGIVGVEKIELDLSRN